MTKPKPPRGCKMPFSVSTATGASSTAFYIEVRRARRRKKR